MVILIIAAVLILWFIYIYSQSSTLERKLISDLKKSPDLSVLLGCAEKMAIKIVPFDIYSEKDNEHRWSAGFSFRFIRISLDKKTKRILPPDPFLQKIIFAHEIGHFIQEKQWVKVIEDCKFLKESGKYDCFYFEIDAWREGFLLLEKLNLFHNGNERKKFWDYANATLKNKKFTPCWQMIQNGECPKTLELRPRIPKGGLD